MIIGGSYFKTFTYWRKYKAEDDFYYRLVENPVYPFEDLGNGFYYIRLRSDKVVLGFGLLIMSILLITIFGIILGFFSLPTSIFLLAVACSLGAIQGSLSNRELILSRLGGYLLRIQTNAHCLCEQEIHNIYIRLQMRTDSLQANHYFLILGGYLLDDIKLSRTSHNMLPMRLMGRRLARNLGINYFDYVNDTIKHTVFHYRGYTTLRWRKSDLAIIFDQGRDLKVLAEESEGVDYYTTDTDDDKPPPPGKQIKNAKK